MVPNLRLQGRVATAAPKLVLCWGSLQAHTNSVRQPQNLDRLLPSTGYEMEPWMQMKQVSPNLLVHVDHPDQWREQVRK
jgi:hypothetical protein